MFDNTLSYKVVAVYKSEIVESSFLVALDNCSLNNILVFKAVVHLVIELLYDLIKSFITIFLSSNALVLSVSIIDCNCSLAVSQYLIYFSTQDNNIRYSLPIFSIQALLLTFLRYHLTSFIQSIVDTQVVLLVKALPTAYFNHLWENTLDKSFASVNTDRLIASGVISLTSHILKIIFLVSFSSFNIANE